MVCGCRSGDGCPRAGIAGSEGGGGLFEGGEQHVERRRSGGRPRSCARAGDGRPGVPARDGRRSPAMRRGIVRVFLPVHGASPVGGDVGEDFEKAGAVAACDEVREGAGQGRVVAFEEGAVDGVERIEPAAAVEEPVACGPAKELSQIAAECTE